MPRQRHRRKGLDTAVPDGPPANTWSCPKNLKTAAPHPAFPLEGILGDEQQPTCLFNYSNDYLTYRMRGVRSRQRTQEQEGLHGCR